MTPEEIRAALEIVEIDEISVSPAVGRDEESVWVLRQRPVRVAGLSIVPADHNVHDVSGIAPATIRLIDAPAFGTGLHPTTALCLEALDEIVPLIRPGTMLDVGTGSGVLACAALVLGVSSVLAIDIDTDALRVAAENARVNGFGDRLQLLHGGPETIAGAWPLVMANILAAPLSEMAPTLIRRVGHRGQLVLSGIPVGVEPDVLRAYTHLGMRRLSITSRAGWAALVLEASW